MERVDTAAPEVAWSELDREWSEFWAAVEAHAHDSAVWFTPARATHLQRLLQRGAQWRRESPHAHAERTLYECHLHRLEPVLQDLKRALAEVAEQILRQRQQLRAARDWVGSQSGARMPRRP